MAQRKPSKKVMAIIERIERELDDNSDSPYKSLYISRLQLHDLVSYFRQYQQQPQTKEDE